METGKKPCLWRNHISTNLTCGMVTFGFTVNAQHTKHHEAVGIFGSAGLLITLAT